ncbi:MAG TPA: ATP-binding protein [Ktedonobacteraceae bacterium]|jgi:SpoVK/Ycf46/Vps4 family AAA+-type ATPase
MTQAAGEPPVPARQVLWFYQGLDHEDEEKDFYTALEAQVAAELHRRLPAGGRLWVGREVRLQIGSYPIAARLTNLQPVQATVADHSTRYLAQFQQRAREHGQDVTMFLSEIIRYPHAELGAHFDALVGLDVIKAEVETKLLLLLNPGALETWVEHIYASNAPRRLLQTLRDRYPLLIFEGEVGSGKTALARSIGHRLAVRMNKELALFVLNAQVRGGGHVGELTQNISRAFAEAERSQEREQIPVILLIDEADALARARGGRQTHHEDDAGVNTLIQRIDRLRGRPIAVIFATNLAQSLDAAIMRRAIASYRFERPDDRQRKELFARLLEGTDISAQDCEDLVHLTLPRVLPGFGETPHRYTYSDISQRLIPQAVEQAVLERQPLTQEHLSRAITTIMPTPEMFKR